MRQTLGALGGRLYPWQHGPLADFGARWAARPCGTYPARPLISARALAAFSSRTSSRPYRGLQHRLHRARTFDRAWFAMAPVV